VLDFDILKPEAHCKKGTTKTTYGHFKTVTHCATFCRGKAAKYFTFAKYECRGSKCLCWCQGVEGSGCEVQEWTSDDLFQLEV